MAESDDLPPWLHGVKVVVVGVDDFRGHDPAHEEDGPWRERGKINMLHSKTCGEKKIEFEIT